MAFIYLLLGIIPIIGVIIIVLVLKKIKTDISLLEKILAIIYIFSLIILCVGFQIHRNQYNIAIDPYNDGCYIPFGGKHIVTLNLYFILFNISILLIWIKGNKLPPLTQVLSLSFILIGSTISFFVLLHVFTHPIEDLGYNEPGDPYFFIFTPIISILISVHLIFKIVKNKMMVANEKKYSNHFLNKLNSFFASKKNLPLWSIILIIPLLVIITIILILLGQDSNSLIKVFTETATWRFSQKMHPPILDHKGHYLCTVAASGNPKIVKPIRLGRRNNRTIIINRQLLIANAFEEMIQDFSPKLHHFIRTNYDKYGYNLSTKINSTQMSNLTYLLMKPLEWSFLLCLYLFCEEPEKKINKQYQI